MANEWTSDLENSPFLFHPYAHMCPDYNVIPVFQPIFMLLLFHFHASHVSFNWACNYAVLGLRRRVQRRSDHTVWSHNLVTVDPTQSFLRFFACHWSLILDGSNLYYNFTIARPQSQVFQAFQPSRRKNMESKQIVKEHIHM